MIPSKSRKPKIRRAGKNNITGRSTIKPAISNGLIAAAFLILNRTSNRFIAQPIGAKSAAAIIKRE